MIEMAPGFNEISSSSKRIKKRTKNTAIINDYKTRTKKFPCPYCEQKVFSKAQALGGHVSKTHPNASQEFAYKIQRRNERAPERELLVEAKKIYAEFYGPGRGYNRARLSLIKKEIKEIQERRQEQDE